MLKLKTAPGSISQARGHHVFLRRGQKAQEPRFRPMKAPFLSVGESCDDSRFSPRIPSHSLGGQTEGDRFIMDSPTRLKAFLVRGRKDMPYGMFCPFARQYLQERRKGGAVGRGWRSGFRLVIRLQGSVDHVNVLKKR